MANKLVLAGIGRGLRARGDTVASTALLEFQSPTAELIARPVPLRGRVTVLVIFVMIASMLAVLPPDTMTMSCARMRASRSATVRPNSSRCDSSQSRPASCW